MAVVRAAVAVGLLSLACAAGPTREAAQLAEYRAEMARLDSEQASAPRPAPGPVEDPIPPDSSQPVAQESSAQWAAEESRVLRTFADEFSAATNGAIQNAAKARGFSEVRVGLRRFLIEVRETGMPLPEVRKKAIRLADDDDTFKVSQVLGSSVLVVAEDLPVFVEGADRERSYEEAPLSALGHLTYKVTGTRSYQSLLGLRQAFVAAPIEDFDVADAVSRALLQKYTGESGRVTVAEFHNRSLVECGDMPAKVYESDAGGLHSGFDTGTAVLLGSTCAAVFSRPVQATCEFAKGSVFVYARPEGYEGIDEDACDKVKGQWRVRETQ